MSFVDRPSPLRVPALAAAVLVNAGLWTLATQLSVSADRHSGGAVVTTFAIAPPALPDQPEPNAREQREPAAPPARSMRARKAPAPPPAALPSDAAASYREPAIPPPAKPAPLQAPITIPPSTAPAPPPPDQRDPLPAYAAQVRALILARKPAATGIAGHTTIGFRLTPTGALADSEVMAPSGNPRLDRLALTMLRQAAPFPAPDPAIPAGALRFRIEVRFR